MHALIFVLISPVVSLVAILSSIDTGSVPPTLDVRYTKDLCICFYFHKVKHHLQWKSRTRGALSTKPPGDYELRCREMRVITLSLSTAVGMPQIYERNLISSARASASIALPYSSLRKYLKSCGSSLVQTYKTPPIYTT